MLFALLAEIVIIYLANAYTPQGSIKYSHGESFDRTFFMLWLGLSAVPHGIVVILCYPISLRIWCIPMFLAVGALVPFTTMVVVAPAESAYVSGEQILWGEPFFGGLQLWCGFILVYYVVEWLTFFFFGFCQYLYVHEIPVAERGPGHVAWNQAWVSDGFSQTIARSFNMVLILLHLPFRFLSFQMFYYIGMVIPWFAHIIAWIQLLDRSL